jgi:hypothetical protein
LIIRGDGENFHLRVFRPFYYYRLEKNEEATYILWPMYAKDREEKPTSGFAGRKRREAPVRVGDLPKTGDSQQFTTLLPSTENNLGA